MTTFSIALLPDIGNLFPRWVSYLIEKTRLTLFAGTLDSERDQDLQLTAE